MLISFALNAVRKLTSEKTAAKLASRLYNRIPRTRLDKWLIDGADDWLFYETRFETCSECYKYVIDSKDVTIHDECQKALDCRLKDEADWLEYESSRAVAENVSDQVDDDDWDEVWPLDAEDDEWVRSESDEECPGGCGQPNYACSCAELESHRRFQADPDTRGSWWTP